MPLFEVEPMAWQVSDPNAFDALLLTSANAVRQGGDGFGGLLALPVYAVGEATAAAARGAGFEVAGMGDGGVDRLLESVPPGLRLLHLCGEHRTAPQSRPTTAVPVYRAVEIAAPEGLARIVGQTVAVHSPRAAARLAELADRAGIGRRAVRIAAISEAAALAAGPGWERCAAADQPNEAALLALAARLCDNPVTT